MANTFLTSQQIARESLPILKSSLLLPRLVHTDYKDEFKSFGDTVQVRKPAVFTAEDFDRTAGSTAQAINEDPVLVKLDKIATVDVEVTAEEMTLNVEDFMNQVGAPAMVALAEKIDTRVAELYKGIPYTVGTAGQTPDGMDDLANVIKALNERKVPMDNRRLVIDPAAHAKFIQLANLAKVNEAGSSDVLRNASIGNVYGLGVYMDQNVQTHEKGDLAANTALTGTKGAYQGTVAAGGNAKTGKKGDVFTIADTDGSYTLTEDCTTLADGTGVLKFYPALPANVAGKVITVTANHTANLAFHRSAFGLVMRPLAPAKGAESYSLSFDGIPLRVTYGYDLAHKKQLVSFDVLYGVAVLYPELAVRLLG